MIQLRSRQVVLKRAPISVGRGCIGDQGHQAAQNDVTEVEKEIVDGYAASSSPVLSKLQPESLKEQNGAVGEKKRRGRRLCLRSEKSVLNVGCSESTVCLKLALARGCLKNTVVKGRRRSSVRFERILSGFLVDNRADERSRCTRSSSAEQLSNANPIEPTGCSSELVAVPPTSLKNKVVKRRMGRAPVQRSLNGLGVENRADERKRSTRSSSAEPILSTGSSAPTACSGLREVSHTSLKNKALKRRMGRPPVERSLNGLGVENRADERKCSTRSSSAESTLSTGISVPTGCSGLREVSHTSLKNKALKRRMGRPPVERSLKGLGVENRADERKRSTRSSSAEPILSTGSSAPTGCSGLSEVSHTSLKNKASKRRMGRPPVERSSKGLGVENRADQRNRCRRGLSADQICNAVPSPPTGCSELVVAHTSLKSKAVKLRLRRVRSEPSLKGSVVESRADERNRYNRRSSAEHIWKAPPGEARGCNGLAVPNILKDKTVKRRGRPRLQPSLQDIAVENVLKLESRCTRSSSIDHMLNTDQSELTECSQFGVAAPTCCKNNAVKIKKARPRVQLNLPLIGLENMSNKISHHPTSSSVKQILDAVPGEPTGSTVLVGAAPISLKGDAVERRARRKSNLQGILEKGPSERDHCSRRSSGQQWLNANPSDHKGCNGLVEVVPTCLKTDNVKTRRRTRLQPNLKRIAVENVGNYCTRSASANQKLNTEFSEQCIKLVGTVPTLFKDNAVMRKRGMPRKQPSLQRIEVGKGSGEGNLCTRSCSAKSVLTVGTSEPTELKRLAVTVPTCLNDKSVKRKRTPRLKPNLQRIVESEPCKSNLYTWRSSSEPAIQNRSWGEETGDVNEVIDQSIGKVVIDEKQVEVDQAGCMQRKKTGRPPGKKGKKITSVAKQSTKKIRGNNSLYLKQTKTLHVMMWKKKKVLPNELNKVLQCKQNKPNSGKWLTSVKGLSIKGSMGDKGKKDRRKAAASGNLKANNRILRSDKRQTIEEDSSAQVTQENNPAGSYLKPLSERAVKLQRQAATYARKGHKCSAQKSTQFNNLATAETSVANRTRSTNTRHSELSDLGNVENKETDYSLIECSNGQNKDTSQCSLHRFSERAKSSLATLHNSNLQTNLHYSANDLNNNNCNTDTDGIQGTEESMRKQKQEVLTNSIDGGSSEATSSPLVARTREGPKPFFERDDEEMCSDTCWKLAPFSPNKPNKLLGKAKSTAGKKRRFPPKELIEDAETVVHQKVTLIEDEEQNPMVLMGTFEHQNNHAGNKDNVDFNTQNGDLEALVELNKNRIFPDSFQLNLKPGNQSTEHMEFCPNNELSEIANADDFLQEVISLLSVEDKDFRLDSECKSKDPDENVKSSNISETEIVVHAKDATNDNQIENGVVSEGAMFEECVLFSCQRSIPMVGKHIWKRDSCARTRPWPFPEDFLSSLKVNMTIPSGYEELPPRETIDEVSTFLVKEIEVDLTKLMAGGDQKSPCKKRKLDPSLESVCSICPTASKDETKMVMEGTDENVAVPECSQITKRSSNLSRDTNTLKIKDDTFISGNQSLAFQTGAATGTCTRKKLGRRNVENHTAPAVKKPVTVEAFDIIMNTRNVTHFKIPLLKTKSDPKTVSNARTLNQETVRPKSGVSSFAVAAVQAKRDQEYSSSLKTSSPQQFGCLETSSGLPSFQKKPVDIICNNIPCRTSSLHFSEDWVHFSEHWAPAKQIASSKSTSVETCGQSTSENVVSFECSVSEETHKPDSLNNAFVLTCAIPFEKLNNCVPNEKDLTELKVYEDDVIVLDVIQDDPDLFGSSFEEELKSVTESANTQKELKYVCKKTQVLMPSVCTIVEKELSNQDDNSLHSPIQECEESVNCEMERSEALLTEPPKLLSIQQPLTSSFSGSDPLPQQTSKAAPLPSSSYTELGRSDPDSVVKTHTYLSRSGYLAEATDDSSEDGQLTDDHKLNLPATDEDVKEENIKIGESEGTTYAGCMPREHVQESDHVLPRLKIDAEQDYRPIPPWNNDFRFTDKCHTSSKPPLLPDPDDCELWKQGKGAVSFQPMLKSPLPAGYCHFYFNTFRGCLKKQKCWFHHVPKEEDEKFCMDMVQKLVNADSKPILFRAVQVFTSYYREVQPGVHYDSCVLDELLISLLKHYMLPEVFHTMNIGANVKILPSVEVFLKVFDHVLTNNVVKAVSSLINLFCKMIEAGMVLQPENLDYIEMLVTQLQASETEINVIVSTKSRLQARQFKTNWLCDLDVAVAEIEHCKEKSDWVKLGTFYVNIRMAFENLTDLQKLSNCIGEALMKDSKDEKVVPFCLFADTVKKDPHHNGLDKNLLGRIGISAMFSYHRSEQWVKGKKIIDKLHEMQINFTVLKGLIGEESEATRCQVVNVAAEILLKSGSLDGAMWVLKESEWVINSSLWTCERMDVLNRHNLLCMIAHETLTKNLYRQTFEVLQHLPGLQDNTDAIDVSRYSILFNKLLDSCVENNSLGISSTVAEFMVSKKIPINFAFLRALITKLGRSCLWLKARAHYKCALNLGCYPPLEGNLYHKMLLIPSYMSEIEMLLAIEIFIVANAGSIQSPGGSKQTLQIVLKRYNEDLAHGKDDYTTAAERMMQAVLLSEPKLLIKHLTVNITMEQVYMLDHCTALKWLNTNMKWAGKVWLF